MRAHFDLVPAMKGPPAGATLPPPASPKGGQGGEGAPSAHAPSKGGGGDWPEPNPLEQYLLDEIVRLDPLAQLGESQVTVTATATVTV